MTDVRARIGSPILLDFASGRGTPLVVDTSNGKGYVLLDDNSMVPINSIGRIDITQSAAGEPQVRLVGAIQGYAELRCGGGGTDDGDFYLTLTGDNVWMQSLTTGHRLTNSLVPSTDTVATAPANLELHGRNYILNATDYERLRIYSKGTSDTSHNIASEAGGGGTLNSIAITAGSNHLWIDAPTGAVCIGTHSATGASVGDLVLNGYLRMRGGIVATASLPAAGSSMDGTIIIEDAGAGDRNLIIYAGSQRFRIDGGAAF